MVKNYSNTNRVYKLWLVFNIVVLFLAIVIVAQKLLDSPTTFFSKASTSIPETSNSGYLVKTYPVFAKFFGSYIEDINNRESGQPTNAVVIAQDNNSKQHAFILNMENGTASEITYANCNIMGFAINKEHVTGSISCPGDLYDSAFYYNIVTGESKKLNRLTKDDNETSSDVNDKGEILGRTQFYKIMYWKNYNAIPVELAPQFPDNRGFAYRINNLGDIVGGGYYRNNLAKPMEKKGNTTSGFYYLDSPINSNTYLTDTNELGLRVGVVINTNSNEQSAKWINDQYILLGYFGYKKSSAVAVNNNSEILICAQNEGVRCTYLLLQNSGRTINLSKIVSTQLPGAVLWSASSLNDSSDVAGIVEYENKLQAVSLLKKPINGN